jgi:hypothetical protein
VDDFVTAGDSKEELLRLLEKLKSFWKLSEMGEVSTILDEGDQRPQCKEDLDHPALASGCVLSQGGSANDPVYGDVSRSFNSMNTKWILRYYLVTSSG